MSGMNGDRSNQNCQNHYDDLVPQTSPDSRGALPLRRRWWRLKSLVWYVSVLGLWESWKHRISSGTRLGRAVVKDHRGGPPDSNGTENLGLKPGEWVEVKSVKEIFSTLDQHGKLMGLAFNREMAKFCGKQFRVYKRLENIILESTGELRKVKTPTVMLEGVFCDGEAHGKCDRSCFCFWREAWLRRTNLDPSTGNV